MIFITNKYTRIYFSIVESARSRVLGDNEYYETHHIVPRSLGGSNNRSNLVNLTAKEHLLCHKLLVKMTDGPAKSKMAFAVVLMSGKTNSRVYSTTKKLLAEGLSVLHKGKIPITNGVDDKTLFVGHEMPDGFYKGFSPDVIKKHGLGNKGKRWVTNGHHSFQPKDGILPEGYWYGQTGDHKMKNSTSNSGESNPNFGKIFITNGFENKTIKKGDLLPDGWVEGKIEKKSRVKSESKKGCKNPNFGKATSNSIQVELDGTVYRSVSEAVRAGYTRRFVKRFLEEKHYNVRLC